MNKLWCYERNSFVAQVGDATCDYSVSLHREATFPIQERSEFSLQPQYQAYSSYNLHQDFFFTTNKITTTFSTIQLSVISYHVFIFAVSVEPQ